MCTKRRASRASKVGSSTTAPRSMPKLGPTAWYLLPLKMVIAPFASGQKATRVSSSGLGVWLRLYSVEPWPMRSLASASASAPSPSPAARAVVWMDVPLRAFAAGGAGARSYPCRCGGAFEIFDDEPCADGDLVPCDGCSAHVRLVA